jgi:hypothetical protein
MQLATLFKQYRCRNDCQQQQKIPRCESKHKIAPQFYIARLRRLRKKVFLSISLKAARPLLKRSAPQAKRSVLFPLKAARPLLKRSAPQAQHSNDQ